jgi:hypothetical protein
MNPTAPNLHAAIHTHKRSIINWKNVPAYAPAKHTANII